jgi:hypothetical protein
VRLASPTLTPAGRSNKDALSRCVGPPGIAALLASRVNFLYTKKNSLLPPPPRPAAPSRFWARGRWRGQSKGRLTRQPALGLAEIPVTHWNAAFHTRIPHNFHTSSNSKPTHDPP